jgi:alkyldihydroxyacetonephosphate synthase
MKKNTYGNIEDIIIGCRCVTPTGVMESASLVPRQSVGPDPLQLVLGSEGALGIITDVVVKVKKVPTARAYGSVVFPSFTAGVAFMRELAAKQAQPSSVRLVDNEQFQFGQALKAKPHNAFLTAMKDTIQKAYVTKIAGFDPNSMVAATLLFEGSSESVAAQQRKLYAIARTHGGMAGGEANGIRGYFLTYMIAYVRDFAMQYWFLAESFETSVPWSNVLALCDSTKATVRSEARAQGVKGPIYVSCRVTQTYDTGAVVYFYFGFMHKGLADPLAAFHHVEAASRRTILSHGGSLSHHHGVGKHRAGYLQNILTPASAAAVRGAKFAVDPHNVMAAGNALFSEHCTGLGDVGGGSGSVPGPASTRAPAAYAPFQGADDEPGAAALALAKAVNNGISQHGEGFQAKL